MNVPFEQSRSRWVRYDCYEFITAKDGKRYIAPVKDAKLDVYNPMKDYPGIVLDALNAGMLLTHEDHQDEAEKAVMTFVTKYGLLGIMGALTLTTSFVDNEVVYLVDNCFVHRKSMQTDEYLALFYPFSKAEYSEPYDWIAQQFKDWFLILTTAILNYDDYDSIDDDTRKLYHKVMAAFLGIVPSYHIELLDKPTICWDLDSLLLGVQMMFSSMLEDDDRPLRLCKHCQKVFIGNRINATFCSARCKNQYNVYKSRRKAQNTKRRKVDD